MSPCRAVLAALLLIPRVAPAEGLPDGLYTCWLHPMILGEMEIGGTAYRGPAFDGNWAGDFPYEVKGDKIAWLGPLGGFAAAGQPTLSRIRTDAQGRIVGFDITVLVDGDPVTTTCDGPS